MSEKKLQAMREFEDILNNFSSVMGKVAGLNGLSIQECEEALTAIKFAYLDITVKILKKEDKEKVSH